MLMHKDKFKGKITEASLKIILGVLSDKSVLWIIKNGVIQNMKAKKLDDLKKIVDKILKNDIPMSNKQTGIDIKFRNLQKMRILWRKGRAV